jgi:hypothetical protein
MCTPLIGWDKSHRKKTNHFGQIEALFTSVDFNLKTATIELISSSEFLSIGILIIVSSFARENFKNASIHCGFVFLPLIHKSSYDYLIIGIAFYMKSVYPAGFHFSS